MPNNQRKPRSRRPNRQATKKQPSLREINSLITRLIESKKNLNSRKVVSRPSKRPYNKERRQRPNGPTFTVKLPSKMPPLGQKAQLNTAIRDVRNRTRKTPVLPDVTKPGSEIDPLDQKAYFLLVEALTSHLCLSSKIAASVTPQEIMYYCWLLLAAHFNEVGQGTSSSSFAPSTTSQTNWNVPKSIEKFLEYNSPYSHNGVKATKRYEPPGFLSTTVNPSIGTINDFYQHPSWFPQHFFYPMTTTQNSTISTILDVPHIDVFTIEPQDGYSFEEFLIDTTRIELISQTLGDILRCKPLCKIPKSAPDSSAYSKLKGPIDANGIPTVPSCIGIDTNYDPELTIFFSPTTSASTQYNTSNTKPYKGPSFRPRTISCPDSYQIASVWVYIAEHFEHESRPGRFTDVFTFEGHKLDTLYPQEQAISGIGLGGSVQATHAQIIASKPGQQQDPNGTCLCLEAIVAYTGQQQRLNHVEVIHLQCPAIPINSFGAGNQFPQINYVEDVWNNLQLALPATNISVVGPIVVDGQLRIPFCNYDGVVTTGTSNPMGPMKWSAIGLYEDAPLSEITDTAPTNLTFPSTIVQPLVEGALAPNVVWDNSRNPPRLADLDLLENWYGGNNPITIGPYDAVPTNVYPLFPTSNAANSIQFNYNEWILEGIYGQTPPFVPVNDKHYGDITVMSSSMNFNQASASASSQQPNGTPTGQQVISDVTMSPSTLALPGNTDAESAALTGVAMQGIVDFSSHVAGPKRSRYLNVLRVIGNAGSTASIPQMETLGGAHRVSIPWGSSKKNVMSNLAQQLSSTSSPFYDEVAKMQMSGNYDIVSLIKKYCGPALRQSMGATHKKDITINQFAKQSKDVTGKKGGKFIDGLAKKASGVVGDVVKMGLDTITGQLKGGAKELEQSFIDFF